MEIENNKDKDKDGALQEPSDEMKGDISDEKQGETSGATQENSSSATQEDSLQNRKTDTNDQIFDKVFHSGCAWHKRLMIPLVNAVFGKDIPEQAKIEQIPNERFFYQKDENGEDKLTKQITDAVIRYEEGKYHFECESKNDGKILLRLGGYDLQIALDDAEYKDHTVVMELPETAVIFLRNYRNLPDHGEILYKKGDRTLIHEIPYIQMGKYSLESLAEKHLYLLLPFYLMRYEHAIRHNTEKKFEKIEDEAKKVYNVLTKANQEGYLTDLEYEDIVVLCGDVVKEIGKESRIKERMVTAMGTGLLLTAEERGVVKGMEKGLDLGGDQMLSAIDLINSGYKTVQDLVSRGISPKIAEKAIGRYIKPV